MLIKDFKDLKVSLVPSLSQEEFNLATKEIFKKFDYPIPVIGLDNWESFDYLISKGVYAGSLIKRLTKWLKKEQGVNPDAVFVGQIGNVIGKITNKNSEIYYVTMSNYFDWTPGTFNRNQTGGSDEKDSCFWRSRNCAREALRELYDARSIIVKNSAMDYLARCWIISGMDEDFSNGDYEKTNHDVIFNAYGELELYKIARILTYCGYSSYNKVDFYTTDDIGMYINSDSGFAMSVSGEACNKRIRIDPNYEYYNCVRCGDVTSIYDGFVCDECKDNQRECACCGYKYFRDDGRTIGYDFYCDECVHEIFNFCERCGDYVLKEKTYTIEESNFCESCYHYEKINCCKCNSEIQKSNSRRVFSSEHIEMGRLCSECENDYDQCKNCYSYYETPIEYINTLDYTFNYGSITIISREEKFCETCTKSLVKISENVFIRIGDLRSIAQYLDRGGDVEKYIKNGNILFEFDFDPISDSCVDNYGSLIHVHNLFSKISEKMKHNIAVR